MTGPRTYRRVVRNRKAVPLSKLRASDVVKTVVDHPRRLEELLRMLEEKDRGVRGRAATTIARLSESHPARMFRVIQRLREALVDDSAYVRWHLVYSFGKLELHSPAETHVFLSDLVSRLEDENRIVRSIASKAIVQVAAQKPLIVEEIFQNLKKDIPPLVARVIRKAKTQPE
jgi:HEAT repeat protein